MLKTARNAWKLLSPVSRSHPLFLRVHLAKFQCDSAACLARKAGALLAMQGKLPASVREGEIVVREDLCPQPESSVLIKRKTAWCQRMTRSCPMLRSHGPDWVECAALQPDIVSPPNVVVRERRGGILDILMGLLSVDFKNQPYTSTLKVTAPILLWKAIQEQRKRRPPPETIVKQTKNLVRSMLIKRKLPFSVDPQGWFFLRDSGDKIRVLKTGDVEFRPRVGTPTTFKAFQIVTKLDALLALHGNQTVAP